MGSKWLTATALSGGSGGGVTLTRQVITPTASQTTTSTSMDDLSNGSATLADREDGMALCIFFANIEMSDNSNQYQIGLEIDGTDQFITSNHSSANNVTGNAIISQIFDTDGQTLQLRWKVAGGTATLAGQTTTMSKCVILEIS